MKNKTKEYDVAKMPTCEQIHPTQNLFMKWANTGTTTISVCASIILSIISLTTVNKVKKDNEESINKITNEISTLVSQQQKVDVIQARETDILIKISEDNWLVIPMFTNEDFTFSTQIKETQYHAGEQLDGYEFQDLFNNNNSDWSNKNSFTYSINTLSISQAKMFSLKPYIESMTAIFQLYDDDKITHLDYPIKFYNKNDKCDYLNVFENISPKLQFRTGQLVNDGIENIKINIIIEFKISETSDNVPYVFDSWIPVKENILF